MKWAMVMASMMREDFTSGNNGRDFSIKGAEQLAAGKAIEKLDSENRL